MEKFRSFPTHYHYPLPGHRNCLNSPVGHPPDPQDHFQVLHLQKLPRLPQSNFTLLRSNLHQLEKCLNLLGLEQRKAFVDAVNLLSVPQLVDFDQ
jgi:hypothetical protein